MATMRVVSSVLAGMGLGLAVAASAYFKRRKTISLQGRVVLITGSSRGLGLALAHEFGSQGARLVICARQSEELELARLQLEARGIEVLALPCDIQDGEQIQRLVEQALARFGQIDVLVNNAGIILVGPASTMTLSNYEACMDTMFWGTVKTTLALLPHMRAQKSGRIINITSIGGRVSVPHLLPYSSAKFAALGFSEGLHAELAKEGILVTSVIPGLMRTGSHINAFMKGKREEEYTLFGLMATLPLTATSAASAARQIVHATRRGTTELIITPQAQLLSRFHGLFPGITTSILSLVNRGLPAADATGLESRTGREIRSNAFAWLTHLGEPAAHAYNQYAHHDS